MKVVNIIVLGLLGLALQGTASAQIYESRNAEGGIEFSDTPTESAEVVDLQQTNVADGPVDMPEAPQAEAAPAAAAPRPGEGAVGAGEMGDPGYDVYGDAAEEDNVREQRREDADRIDHALPGNAGPGVGAPGMGVEPHPVETGPGRVERPAAAEHAGAHEGGRR